MSDLFWIFWILMMLYISVSSNNIFCTYVFFVDLIVVIINTAVKKLYEYKKNKKNGERGKS